MCYRCAHFFIPYHLVWSEWFKDDEEPYYDVWG